jgi:hypothetical protein
MKRRFMFAIIGWTGGTLLGWYIQRLTGWHFPMYLGFLTGVVAVLGGKSTGNVKTFDDLANSLSLFSSERRHSQ